VIAPGRRSALTLAAACALWTTAAAADEPSASSRRLSGAYGMAFSQTCILTPFGPPPSTGFDPTSGALLQEAEVISSESMGVLRLRRNGTATIEGGLLTEAQQNKLHVGDVPAMARIPYTCQGTYQRSGSRLALELGCNPTPPQPAITITIGPFRLAGFVSADEESLNLAALEGNVQSVEVAVGGTVVQRRERICLQHLSFTRLRE
jgi:hypothetical protein